MVLLWVEIGAGRARTRGHDEAGRTLLNVLHVSFVPETSERDG